MIKELILENYIPLLSSGITKVELNTEHLINVLIATNGVGKTSILKQLNPLPPENNDFKEGRKYVKIEENGNLYVLDSTTGKGNGHSFKINNKELNTGGTFTAQKELVEAHFHLDGNINKVLSGLKVPDRLSAMGIARRKDIFMKFYPNDTEYALRVYHKLKEERNNLKGAIKNQIQRYTEEKNKLAVLNNLGIDALEEKVKTIEQDLKNAFLLRGSLEGIQLDPELQDKVNKLSKLIDVLTLDIGDNSFKTKEEIIYDKNRYTEMAAFNKRKQEHYTSLINEYSSSLSGLSLEEKNPEQFKTQLSILEEEHKLAETELGQLKDVIVNYPLFSKEELYESLVVITETLIGYLNRVTVASTRDLTAGIYKQYLQQYEEKGNLLNGLRKQISDKTHTLKHYESIDDVDCPQCNTRFKVGVTPADISKLKQEIYVLTERVSKEEREYATLKDKIDNDEEWYNSMNQLFVFIRENSHVSILLELIKRYNVGKTSSETLINALRIHSKRFNLIKRTNGLTEEENVLKSRIRIFEDNNMSNVFEKIKYTEELISYHNSAIHLANDKLKTLDKEYLSIINHEKNVDVLRFLMDDIRNGLKEKGRHQLKRRIDDVISQLSPEKDKLLSDIIRTRSLSSVVESIEEDVKRLKKRLVIVETLMDGLCPNKGLIGRLMSDFITTVCGNMNAIIKQIWNSTLYVKPCNKENGDLTYKFPVINGDNSVNSDIVDCSGGETEIIDFVFRLVMSRYHKADYPLIMDETGAFLDEINRGRFFSFVKDFVLSGECQQLFLVSHYVNQYGIFTKPNIIGLKCEGLTVNHDEVNKHSVIT